MNGTLSNEYPGEVPGFFWRVDAHYPRDLALGLPPCADGHFAGFRHHLRHLDNAGRGVVPVPDARRRRGIDEKKVKEHPLLDGDV